MTNNEDIRTGNMVLINMEGLPVTVIEVEPQSVLLKSLPVNSHKLKENIYGVPLTTNILLGLNFNNDKTIDSWSGQGITIHLKEDGAFYGLRLLKNRAKIQYLHQLQNYIADYHTTFKNQTGRYVLLMSTCCKTFPRNNICRKNIKSARTNQFKMRNS